MWPVYVQPIGRQGRGLRARKWLGKAEWNVIGEDEHQSVFTTSWLIYDQLWGMDSVKTTEKYKGYNYNEAASLELWDKIHPASKNAY